MPAVITVPYQEMHAGLEESVDLRGVYAVKKYKVAWKDRWQFLRDVAGRTVISGSASAPVLVRSAPLQYPDNKNLYANGISVEPIGASYCTNPGSYDQAIVTVNFGTPEFDYEVSQQGTTQNTVYRSLTLNLGAQVMTLPESAFEFNTPDSGGHKPPVTVSPGFLMPTVEITITSHQIPYLNFDLIFPLVGSLNNATFYGCATGTLMFMGAQASRQATSEGLQAWDLEYKFNYRTVDWNMFYSPLAGVGFDFLKQKSTGNLIYSYMDFTTLP